MEKVFIAMSGGVDSSVAAAMLVEQGYSCMGATMKLHSEDTADTCLTSNDIEDAKSVAKSLGIDYQVYDFYDDFEDKVVRPFIECYLSGRTPNPCVECNRNLKFRALLNKAREKGYDYIATGHYVRREFDEKLGKFLLKKAVDASKDQSYVLYSLTQDELAHTLFPLGNLTKAEIRSLAEQKGFINANKKDSQDICFVPDGKYAEFIVNRVGEIEKGNFVDENGNILGEHKGIIYYTIGQRKGLGVTFGKPMFVSDIRPESREVVLTENDGLFKSSLVADNVNLISLDSLQTPTRLKARIRYNSPEQDAVAFVRDGLLYVEFDTPQRAITRGQAVVLYDGETVLGGGTII